MVNDVTVLSLNCSCTAKALCIMDLVVIYKDLMNQRINYISAIFIVGYWMRALFGIVFKLVHAMFSTQCVPHIISFLVVSSPFKLSFYHSNILYIYQEILGTNFSRMAHLMNKFFKNVCLVTTKIW